MMASKNQEAESDNRKGKQQILINDRYYKINQHLNTITHPPHNAQSSSPYHPPSFLTSP